MTDHIGADVQTVKDMTVAFLPLDTRPCTYDLPVQLARQSGAEVLLPPNGMVAAYKQASDTAALARWLEETAPGCDALVVSAEQLLQGGLIPSRQARVSAARQCETLEVLKRIRRKTPSVRTYLSNVLMRTSISTLDPESLVWWEKVNLYSKLCYRAKTGRCSEAAQQCRALEQEIPAEVLRTFLTARGTNHRVNRECIRLAAEGVVDELLILQEDCAPEGLQRFEQETLLRDIQAGGLSDRVFLFNGTDEAGAELLQKALHPGGCAVEVAWLGRQPDFVAKYEDRPFRENLAEHMRALCMRQEQGARRVLFVLTPKQEQREASLPSSEAPHDYSEAELQAICRTIGQAAAQGRSCYLLDLDFANGGNPFLLECLAKELPVTQLWGYAAWNTASNALGTLLAQILAGDQGNGALNRAFTADRILDDVVYQAIVRQAVAARVKADGQDVYNIRDIPKTQRWLEEEFEAVRPLLEAIFGGEVPAFEARLRWPRLFEAAVFTKAGGGPVYTENF